MKLAKNIASQRTSFHVSGSPAGRRGLGSPLTNETPTTNPSQASPSRSRSPGAQELLPRVVVPSSGSSRTTKRLRAPESRDAGGIDSSCRRPTGLAFVAVETWDAIRARRNVRSYDERGIAPEHLDRILEAGRRSPSASNRQLWDFVLVTDPSQLQELSKVWMGARHLAGKKPGLQVDTVDAWAIRLDGRRS